MVGSSKILTVSYGTFSCTLEGFDNPFGTMQGIAEYFRDLAAEDRYFGAEPPQPDAQMLHQIAEREVRRRVEARVEDTGVVLRQMDSAPAEEAAPQTAPATETPAPAASEAPPTGGETVAEKLARIRTVVAKARAERERTYAEDEPVDDTDDESLLSAFASAEDAETTGEGDETYGEEPQVDDDSEPLVTSADALNADDATLPDAVDDEVLPAVILPPAPDTAPVEMDATSVAAAESDVTVEEVKGEAVPDRTPEQADAADDIPDAIAADTPEEETHEADDTTTDAGDAPADMTSPAAALAVGGMVSPLAAGLDLAPAERAEAAPEVAVIDLNETELRIAEDEEARSAEEQDIDGETDDTSSDEAMPQIAAVSADPQPKPDAMADTERDDADTLTDDTLDADDDPIAAIVAAVAAAEAPVATVPETDVAEAEAQAPSDDDADADDDSDADDHVELEMEDEDGNPSLVRLTRAEFEEMLASGEIEEVQDDAEPEDAADPAEAETADDTIRGLLADTGLSDDDRDALAADLAALETEDDAPNADAASDVPIEDAKHPEEMASDDTEDDATVEPEAVADQTPEGQRRDGSDSDLDRLIDKANTQLDEPEGNRRRSAIQHLKRAVAATKADSGLRDRSGEVGASIAKFRDDLRQVVRPRRPETGSEEARMVRPSDTLGSGPLVLVSSQRVDQAVAPSRPVKPSRPAAVAAAPVDTAEVQSFSEFAERRGARELPDLLEAAAAYAMIVEGQDGASRPQLLRRAASITGEANITREEGLKSFGQLLRAGRLRKLSAGKFALPEEDAPRDSAAG